MAKRLSALATWKPSASYNVGDQKAPTGGSSSLLKGRMYLFFCHHRLAVRIAEVEWVDCILNLIGAKADHRHDGALEIVIAVDAHCVGVHLPAIGDARDRWCLFPH